MNQVNPIISLADARTQGLKLYYTGEPCSRGHLAARRTSTRACVECQKENKQAYRQSDKGKATEQAYRKTDKNKEIQKAYKQTDKSKAYRKAYMKEYDQSERRKAYKKVKDAEYKQSDRGREVVTASRIKYRTDNPSAEATSRVTRRYPSAIVPLTDEQQKRMDFYYYLAATMRKRTGEDWHIDHAWPLSREGVHHPDNLQLLPASLNCKKYNKVDPSSYSQFKGLLVSLSYKKGQPKRIAPALLINRGSHVRS